MILLKRWLECEMNIFQDVTGDGLSKRVDKWPHFIYQQEQRWFPVSKQITKPFLKTFLQSYQRSWNSWGIKVMSRSFPFPVLQTCQLTLLLRVAVVFLPLFKLFFLRQVYSLIYFSLNPRFHNLSDESGLIKTFSLCRKHPSQDFS